MTLEIIPDRTRKLSPDSGTAFGSKFERKRSLLVLIRNHKYEKAPVNWPEATLPGSNAGSKAHLIRNAK